MISIHSGTYFIGEKEQSARETHDSISGGWVILLLAFSVSSAGRLSLCPTKRKSIQMARGKDRRRDSFFLFPFSGSVVALPRFTFNARYFRTWNRSASTSPLSAVFQRTVQCRFATPRRSARNHIEQRILSAFGRYSNIRLSKIIAITSWWIKVARSSQG